MSEVNSLNSQSLYFAATAAASQLAPNKAKQSLKTSSTGKSKFASALKHREEQNKLLSEDLPIELAGMEMEDAVVFLKDAVDLAGDALKKNQTPQTIEQYKHKVSQLMRYIVHNNFEVIKKQVRGIRRKTGKPRDPRVQIKIINEQLNKLTADIIYNHADNLAVLKRIDELNGLIVDLIAA